MPKRSAQADTPLVPPFLAEFPTITVAPHSPRLPPGLWLAGDARAALLPDGRALPLDLPDAVLARYAPDLFPGVADPVPPPPTIAEV